MWSRPMSVSSNQAIMSRPGARPPIAAQVVPMCSTTSAVLELLVTQSTGGGERLDHVAGVQPCPPGDLQEPVLDRARPGGGMLGEALGGGEAGRTGRRRGQLPLLITGELRPAGALQTPGGEGRQPERCRGPGSGGGHVQPPSRMQRGVRDRGAQQPRIAQPDGGVTGSSTSVGVVEQLDPGMQHPAACGDGPGAACGDPGVDDRLSAQLIQQGAPLGAVTAGDEGEHPLILAHAREVTDRSSQSGGPGAGASRLNRCPTPPAAPRIPARRGPRRRSSPPPVTSPVRTVRSPSMPWPSAPGSAAPPSTAISGGWTI